MIKKINEIPEEFLTEEGTFKNLAYNKNFRITNTESNKIE